MADKSLITDLLKTPSQIRKEREEQLLTEGLAQAQLFNQGNRLGGVGGMFAGFGASQAAMTGRDIDRATTGLRSAASAATGKDFRRGEERVAAEAQSIMKNVKMDDLKSMRDAVQKLQSLNPRAAESLNRRLMELEATEAKKKLETQKKNAAADYIGGLNSDLGEAVRSGAIPAAEALKVVNQEPKVVGGSLVAPDGTVLYEEAPEPQTSYSVLTKSEANSLGLPQGGSYKRNNKTGEVTAIGGRRVTNIGTIPKDHRAVFDYDENGNESVRFEVIEGSATAKAIADEESSKGAKGSNILQRTEVVRNAVADAKKIITENDTATGITGALISMTGPFAAGSARRDLESKITTIKANVGFDRLQRMREESPTGGALGQVAVQELNALQSVLGSLDPNQSDEQLLENLNQVEKAYLSAATAFANAYTDEQLEEYGLDALKQYRNIEGNGEVSPENADGLAGFKVLSVTPDTTEGEG